MLGVVERVCTICARASASYRCPSCNAPYCSAACYASHDSRCTEAFYKRCVAEEVAAGAPVGASADAKRVLAMVQADVSSRDAAPPLGSSEREDWDAAVLSAALQDITVGDGYGDEDATGADSESFGIEEAGSVGREAAQQQTYAPDARTSSALAAAAAAVGIPALSSAQQSEFLRAVASGALSDAVARDWVPWWMGECDACHSSAGCTDCANGGIGGDSAPVCALATKLPPLRTLTRATPAPEPLAAGVTGVILAYVHLQRLYVGDWADEAPQELAALLLHLSPPLSAAAQHMSTAEVAAAYAAAAAAPGLAAASPAARRAHARAALRDAANLLGGAAARLVSVASAPLPRRSHYAADALLHCQAVLRLAAAGTAPAPALSPAAHAALVRAERKLHFLACWCADAEAAAEDALGECARELAAAADDGGGSGSGGDGPAI